MQRRTIDLEAYTVEVGYYQPEHWYDNQTTFIDGFPLDPNLREGFDVTPNDMREPKETEDWWDRPYIVSSRWDDREAYDRAHHKKLTQEGSEYACSPEELEERLTQYRENWFGEFPDGVRYDVRCLDGGAWDRSTGWGMVSTLEDAVELCKKGPAWRSQLLR